MPEITTITDEVSNSLIQILNKQELTNDYIVTIGVDTSGMHPSLVTNALKTIQHAIAAVIPATVFVYPKGQYELCITKKDADTTT